MEMRVFFRKSFFLRPIQQHFNFEKKIQTTTHYFLTVQLGFLNKKRDSVCLSTAGLIRRLFMIQYLSKDSKEMSTNTGAGIWRLNQTLFNIRCQTRADQTCQRAGQEARQIRDRLGQKRGQINGPIKVTKKPSRRLVFVSEMNAVLLSRFSGQLCDAFQ